MFLEIVKNKNVTYLYKAWYLTTGKGRYKRVRELIGRLDKLQLEFDDPISHFRDLLEKETSLQNELKKDNKIDISFIQENLNLNDIASNRLQDKPLEKNVGSILLQYIFYQTGFDALLNKIQYKEKTKIKLSKVLQLLILCRCLMPNSKLSDFNNKDKFIDNFNLSLDDIYRGLEILNKYKDDIITNLNDNINKFINYDLSNTHYDLTNYFVYTDDTTLLIQKGYSKVKNGKPTIQQALLTDSKGLPINYKLFSGNRNDVSTLVEFLESQKKRYNFKNSTIVADAGILSNDNIVKILLSKNQYIFKESLLRVNKNILNTFEQVVKPKIEETMKENPKLKGCFFSVVLDTELKVKNYKGEIVKVKIPQKYIFTYSEKFDRRLERARLEQLENIDKYIKDSSKLKNNFKKTLPDLVKVDTTKANIEIDEEKLNRYESSSGYSLLITSKIESEDRDILEAYKRQYLIEESFRIFKTNLDIDNIYLRKDNRIEGHFLSGFLSLAFLRILQSKMNNKYSISKIQEELREFKICNIRGTNYHQLSQITPLIAELQMELDVEINKNIYDGKQIKVIVGNVKKIKK